MIEASTEKGEATEVVSETAAEASEEGGSALLDGQQLLRQEEGEVMLSESARWRWDHMDDCWVGGKLAASERRIELLPFVSPRGQIG